MTAHTCTTLTRGCYRCDLGVDEMRSALDEMRAEAQGLDRAIDVLVDDRDELRQDIEALSQQISYWDNETTEKN